MLFPYLELNATADPAEMATQVSRCFDQSGIVELILADRGSRVKFLYMLARLSRRTNASAQIAPRRRDFRARALVTKGALAGTAEVEALRVSSRTDPTKLAESMRVALLGRSGAGAKRQRGGVELRIVGPGSAVTAMFALEQLRFDSWHDIRFAARFEAMEVSGGSTLVGVVVTLGIATFEAPQEDAEDEGGDAEEDGDTELPQVRWTPPLTPDLFPTLFMSAKTGTMRLGTKLTATLSVCTTNIVEVLLLDRQDSRAKLFYTLASLPPWLEAVAQVAARRGDSRSRFRIVRDYPLHDAPQEPILRVSGSTEPRRLAMALFSRLLDKRAPEEAVALRLVGRDAAARALLALEHLQGASKREVTFRPRFVDVREEGEEGALRRGIEVTVMAT